jgi:predicted nucleotidyltransferase
MESLQYNAYNVVMGYREEYHELMGRLLNLLTVHYGERLVTAAIFGSVARDTFRPDSDIDMLIIAGGLPVGRMKRVSEFEENVERKLSVYLGELYMKMIYPHLSPVIKTVEEVNLGSPLFLDMTENLNILFDKDNFFRNYIDGLKEKMERLGSKRVYFKGGYYWLLKPDYKYGDIIDL